MEEFDVVIIGGGITGTAIARELSKYQLKLGLIEANLDIGEGATKGNGGVIHAGYDPNPSTLKSKLNVKGSLKYPDLSKKLGFKFKNMGSFVVGFNENDLEHLKMLLDNGNKNGVPGIKIIGIDEMKMIEPHVNDNAKYALYAPTAGVVEPFEVAMAFAENAYNNGCKIFRGQSVKDIKKVDDLFHVFTQDKEYLTHYIINAAGVYADIIANMVGIHDYVIKPRLGELLVLDKSFEIKLNTVLFPIPSEHTKGIVVIPTVAGNVLVGSTAKMIEDKDDTKTSREGIDQLLSGAKLLVPEINPKAVIREFAGLRPVAINNNDDFYIGASDDINGFISVAGIQSPGVASAPAIAEYVRDLLYDAGLDLKSKADFKEYREPIVKFNDLTDTEKDKLIKENPLYGRVICRCETVTEGEIVDAIRRPVGAITVDGIKRRVRAGMGRCQSGFCGPRVLEILSRELKVNPIEITKFGGNSYILESETKEIIKKNAKELLKSEV